MEKIGLDIFSSDTPLKEHLAVLTTATPKGKALAAYSIFKSTATKEMGMREILTNFKSSKYAAEPLIDRAIGSLMALAIGDSLGSQTEGQPVDYERFLFDDFDQKYFTVRNMVAGDITDDTAMSQCLADSLITCRGFDPKDFLKKCSLWWFYGYNNFTGLGTTKPKLSHGMGSTSKKGIMDFIESKYEQSEATTKGYPTNGCVMRLGPIAIYYYPDVTKAIANSVSQSRTTHITPETNDASRILSYIIVKSLGYPKIYNGQRSFAREFFDSLDYSEILPLLETDDAKAIIKSEGERNWKSEDFKYEYDESGILALDGLSMAMHISYIEENIKDIILKAVNMGGDSDTVAAIAGQMMGGLYGVSAIPPKWLEIIMEHDHDGEIALKAILMIKKNY